MKRFSKMVALGLAAAMMLGMTVNAAPSDELTPEETGVLGALIATTNGGVQDEDGNTVEGVSVDVSLIPEEAYENPNFGTNYEEAVKNALNSDAVLDAVFAKNPAFVTEDPDASTITADVEAYLVEVTITPDGEIPPEGLWVAIMPVLTVDEEEGYKYDYVVAHWNGETETWEVLDTEVRGDYVYAKFTSFSPVMYVYVPVVPVGDDQPPVDDPTTDDPTNDDPTTDKPATDKPATSNPSTPSTPSTDNGDAPVSPKTGETMPVAGILAVICLAGAVVCAKKVRYNR